MVHRRLHGPPGSDRSHRRVGPEREGHPGRGQCGEVVHRRGAIGAQPAHVEPVRAAPGGIEHRLHAGHHTGSRQGGDGFDVGHLGVFDPVGAARQPDGGVRPQPIRRGQQGPPDGRHRVVTDGVEAGLDAGDRTGEKMLDDLLVGQVAGAAIARVVRVRVGQRGGPGADRPVDDQVPAERVRARLGQRDPCFLG